MAKTAKTTKAPAAPSEAATQSRSPEALAKARAAREAAVSKDKFFYVGEPSKKIAPQAQTIVNVIKTFGDDGVTRADLVVGLKGVLQTRQPEGRILSYYQKTIQEVGAVRIESGKPGAEATSGDAAAE